MTAESVNGGVKRKRLASELAVPSTTETDNEIKLNQEEEEESKKKLSVVHDDSSNSDDQAQSEITTNNDDSNQNPPTFELVDFERPQAPMHPSQMHDDEGDNDADDSADDMMLQENDDGGGQVPDRTAMAERLDDGFEEQPGTLGGKSLAHLQQSLRHQIDPTSPALSDGTKKSTEEKPPRQESRKFCGLSKIEHYEVMQTVGEGTFGQVTVGKDKRNGKVVALKKISMKNEKEGLPVTALREIKILKMMNHPNVIELIEIATRPGDRKSNTRAEVYMVFPYMDHDLSGIIESNSIKLNASHIKSYLKQLLEGTAYLHQAKLIHRDMKTANILIDNQGNLKLADFGLARTYTPDERRRKYTNMVVTRWYRPPELILGETKYGPAVDMWGVGCVFGEMLRRQPILPGGSGKENEEEASFDQLDRIFKLRGTPTQETWPDWEKLPKLQTFGGRFKNTYRSADLTREFQYDVRRERIDVDEGGISLLGLLLILNPKTRITAKDALNHPYFSARPYAARPGTPDFPIWEPSHELDARKRKEQGAAAARAGASIINPPTNALYGPPATAGMSGPPPSMAYSQQSGGYAPPPYYGGHPPARPYMPPQQRSYPPPSSGNYGGRR